MRGKSNSEILAKECEKGARDAGHDVEFLSLRGKDIRFCIGCLSCQKTGSCVLKDDVPEIMTKVKEAEVVVFATPIYYYEMSGQMKTLLDRLNPLYDSDYCFRDIYMIATAAEDESTTIEKAYNGLQGWVDCFERATLKGYVFGGGINDAGEAVQHAEAMRQAIQPWAECVKDETTHFFTAQHADTACRHRLRREENRPRNTGYPGRLSRRNV